MTSMKVQRTVRTPKALIKRAALVAAFGVLGTTAAAEEQAPKFTMTVISDGSGSGKVLKGYYASAVDRITAAKKARPSNFASLTNLCVAYTKLGELDRADETCEAAVQLVVERRDGRSRAAKRDDAITAADKADLAVALSNRGVLRAARGDWDRAFDDFQASLELDAGLSAAGINLARLDSAGSKTY